MSITQVSDGSTAQSQRFAAAETLIEHAQLPRSGLYSSNSAYGQRTNPGFSQPLSSLAPTQYQQSPHDDSLRRPVNDTETPEFSASIAPRTRSPTAPSQDRQRQHRGPITTANVYRTVAQLPEPNLLAPISERTPESFKITGRLGSSHQDDNGSPNAQYNIAHNARLAKREDSPAGHPAWAELKTKAGKERKRLPLACISCRRKKIRCSGEKPTCKHCLRSRNPCIYKVSARKAVPRTDYFAMLDKRLKRMEERVIKTIPDKSPKTLLRASIRPAQSDNKSKTHQGKKRTATDAFEPDWSESARRPQMPAQLSRGSDHDGSKDLTEGHDKLPPLDLQEHLAEVFFDTLYGASYNLLHKPSFMQRLKMRSVPPVLILAVCAVSARFSTHPQIASEPRFLRGEEWAQPAREISLKYYDEPNITICTVYLLLCIHEFGTCHGGRSWMLGGMAVRMAFALQLNQDLKQSEHTEKENSSTPSKRLQLSFVDQEIRRRTMFACFLMDRYTSSGGDRATFVSEANIHVQLPIRERNFQNGTSGNTEGLEDYIQTRNAVHSTDREDQAVGAHSGIKLGLDKDKHASEIEEKDTDADTTVLTNNAGPSDETSGLQPRDAEESKENLGAVAYIIRGVALWHRILQYMNLGGKERDPYPLWDINSLFFTLRDQANDLVISVPSRLQNTEENLRTHAAEKLGNQFLYMHIIFNHVVMCLYRFAVPSSPSGKLPKNMPEQFCNEAAPRALEAATNISMLLEKAQDYQVVAPFAGYCTFISCTVHIWGAFSRKVAIQASSRKYLAVNMRYLNRMKHYWGMFHYLGENLKDIYRQYADALKTDPDAPKIPSEHHDVVQFGDWFSKYPHGVSKSNYLDPMRETEKEHHIASAITQQSNLQSVEEYFKGEPASTPTDFQRQRKAARDMHRDKNQNDEGLPAEDKSPPEGEHVPQPTKQQPRGGSHQQQSPEPPQTPITFPTEADIPQTSVISPNAMLSHTLYTSSHPTFSPHYGLPVNLPNPGFNFLHQQIDRQLIYGAYSNVDPNSPAMDPLAFQGMPPPPVNPLGPDPMCGGGHVGWDDSTQIHMQQQIFPPPAAYLDIADSAWGTPFNLDPPLMMDEGGFGGFVGDGNIDEYEGINGN